MKKVVTVITPTYNRKNTLKKLYHSLLEQTDYNFEWLIIDDGSTDNTDKVIADFQNDKFTIKYLKKSNGGKHTALNVGMSLIKTELTFIVDSDDLLIKNAIEIINNVWNKYKKEKLAGMIFLKKNFQDEIIGNKFNEVKVGNYLDIINNDIKGDKAEVWVTDILKKYPFPSFQNEKFLGEGIVWISIAEKYNVLFRNEAIYMCEYLDTGLTKSGRKLRIKNPLGRILYSKVLLKQKINIKVKIKEIMMYTIYSFFAKRKLVKIYQEITYKKLFIILLPFSYMVYLYWKYKYE